MLTVEIPFHEGELEVQARCNATDMAQKISGLFSDKIPEGAFQFIEQQPMCVVGSVDSHGNVWASMLFGEPGFLCVHTARQLVIDTTTLYASSNDVMWNSLLNNPNIGLLVIDLATRRRLRINGQVKKISVTQYAIDVERSYSNCPKYIQRRFWKKTNESITRSENKITVGNILDESHIALIESADTFFVASSHPTHGVDASHRGGFPGFVQVIGSDTIRVPDYSGNNMFNTLGNFKSYSHAGLIFVDFDTGRLLQLSGQPQIIFENDHADQKNVGYSHYWLFRVEQWQQQSAAFGGSWEFQEFSPFNPA